MKIYFVIPLYNESAAIPLLFGKIRSTCEGLSFAYEIIAVDDGSTDETPKLLTEWSEKIPLTVVHHKINRGLGETIRDGFEKAAQVSNPEDILIRMDGDNTHEPEYIPHLVQKIQDGYDVVIASRYQKGGGMQGVSLYRAFISRVANVFMKCLFPIDRVWDYSCGFRAYQVKIIREAIDLFGNIFIDLKGLGFTCTVEKLIKLRMIGARMYEIPFTLRYDQKQGKSKMITNITTLGYLILALKNVYPWGRHNKLLRQRANSMRTEISGA